MRSIVSLKIDIGREMGIRLIYDYLLITGSEKRN